MVVVSGNSPILGRALLPEEVLYFAEGGTADWGDSGDNRYAVGCRITPVANPTYGLGDHVSNILLYPALPWT